MIGWIGAALIFVGIIVGGTFAYFLEIPGLLFIAYSIFSGKAGKVLETAAPYAISAAAPVVMTVGAGIAAVVLTKARDIIGGG